MKCYYFLLLFCLLPSLVFSQETKIQKEAFAHIKAKDLADRIFDSIEADSIQVDAWLFEFAYPDSLLLAKMAKMISTSYDLIPDGKIYWEANDASKRYKQAYVQTFMDTAHYTRASLQHRIFRIDKIKIKPKVTLSAVGFYMDMDSSFKEEIGLIVPEKPVQSFTDGLIEGVIKDQDTGDVLPYTAIGVPNKEIGTISDEYGHFELNYPKTNHTDTLLVSAIGYGRKYIPLTALGSKTTIYLKSEATILQEVQVQEAFLGKAKQCVLGQKRVGFTFGYVAPKQNTYGLGTEAVKLMKPKKGKAVFLNEVSTYISNRKGKEFTFLVHVYAQDSTTLLPGKELLKETLVVTDSLEKGWIHVNLNRFNLVFDKPFYVGFQWTTVRDNNLHIAIQGGEALTRSVAFGEWVRSKEMSWVIKAKCTEIDVDAL